MTSIIPAPPPPALYPQPAQAPPADSNRITRNEERDHFWTTIAEVKRQHRQLQGQFQEQKEQMHHLRTQRERDINALLRQHADELKQQYKEHLGDLDAKLSKMDGKWQTRIDRERLDNADRQAATEKRAREATELVEALKKEENSLKAENNSLKGENDGLKRENDGLEREIDRLQEKLNNALCVSAQARSGNGGNPPVAPTEAMCEAGFGDSNGGQGDRGLKRRRSMDDAPRNVRRRRGEDMWAPSPGRYPPRGHDREN